jgi:hypothetical protein
MFDPLRDLYGAFGAARPFLSLCVLMILGAVAAGGFWSLGRYLYLNPKSDNPPLASAPVGSTAFTSGDNSPIYQAARDINVGSSEEDLRRIIREEVQRITNETASTKRGYFEEAYPLGYTIFGLTERNEVVPFRGPARLAFLFDWSTDSRFEVTKNNVVLLMPNFRVEGAGAFTGCRFAIRREIGAKQVLVSTPSAEIVAEVALTEKEGLVVVLGARPPSRPRNP